MKSTQNLPTKLKELRKQNHYSQEYVAEQLNISRQAISHWENGRAYPDIDNLVLLAELYGVSVDELLDDEGDAEAHDMDKAIAVPATNNNAVLEMIGLAVVLVLSLDFPFGGIIVSLITICWLKFTDRKYYIIYIMCVFCFLISIYELIIVLLQMITYGSPRIKTFR